MVGHWWLLNCTYHTTFFPHVHKATMDFMVYGSPCCLGALGRCRDSTAADWTSPTARRVHSRPRRERAPSSGRSSPAEVIRSPDGKCWDSSWFIHVRIVWKMDIPATLTIFLGEREREDDKYPEDFLANRVFGTVIFLQMGMTPADHFVLSWESHGGRRWFLRACSHQFHSLKVVFAFRLVTQDFPRSSRTNEILVKYSTKLV